MVIIVISPTVTFVSERVVVMVSTYGKPLINGVETLASGGVDA